MERVLVTGAGGFIGNHLVAYLKGLGYWVRGVDQLRRSTCRPPLTSSRFSICDAGRTACARPRASTMCTRSQPTWAAWDSSRPTTPPSCATTS